MTKDLQILSLCLVSCWDMSEIRITGTRCDGSFCKITSGHHDSEILHCDTKVLYYCIVGKMKYNM